MTIASGKVRWMESVQLIELRRSCESLTCLYRAACTDDADDVADKLCLAEALAVSIGGQLHDLDGRAAESQTAHGIVNDTFARVAVLTTYVIAPLLSQRRWN